jgi:hypothetical protein
MWMACADLFPHHADEHHEELWNSWSQTEISAEFTVLITWMLSAASKTDVVVVADGRSDIMRARIRKVFEVAGVVWKEIVVM